MTIDLSARVEALEELVLATVNCVMNETPLSDHRTDPRTGLMNAWHTYYRATKAAPPPPADPPAPDLERVRELLAQNLARCALRLLESAADE